MSEVKRYHVTEAGLVEGQALGRINVVLAADHDRVTAERDALQALLNAADERADVMEGFRSQVQATCEDGKHRTKHTHQQMCRFLDGLRSNAVALKPAEGGGDA